MRTGIHPSLYMILLQLAPGGRGCAKNPAEVLKTFHGNQGKPEFLVLVNQETTRPPGNSEKRKKITRKLPEFSRSLVFLCLICSSEPQDEKKNTIYFLSDFFSGNLRKNLVFDLFTVKLSIIIRNLPGNYLNLIRNQDQENTLRAPGNRVCLVWRSASPNPPK